ncbi:MAG: DUF4167 domain-containing protein [Hyphomicrobiales bacterium]|nr:DUF4167 domain-containing protein [Hyphomicrobiales bacterium]
MRPGSNKRMRGRNRRGPNPLARSYESNGPDVKVRGTAQHIADRYLQLARDAQSSGDPVTAESYFQHAEHYLRIIAAAQEQMQAQYGYRPRTENGAEEEGEGEEGDTESMGAPYPLQNGGYNGQPRHVPPAHANGPSDGDDQPPMFSPPRERFDNRNPRFGDREGWQRQNRGEGNRHDNRRDHYRHDGHRREPYRRDEGAPAPDLSADARGPQPRGTPGEGGEQHGFERRSQNPAHQGAQGSPSREDRRERFERGSRPAREEQALPSFITAPVRPAAPAAETPTPPTEAEAPKEAAGTASTAPDAGAAAPRPRRGRPRRNPESSADAENGAPAEGDGSNPVGAK